MSSLVSCRGLVCRLSSQLVLDGLDFELQHAESLALLGISGSGKSTLLRIIAGLEVPERGEVQLDGQSATRDGRLFIPPHRRRLAMLFQDLALWPNLTVEENVRMGLAGLRLPRPLARDRVTQTLKLCGIDDLAARLPGSLSGGQQQRVALARALAVQPRLLLLDEPFGGLDLLTKEQLVREIAQLKRALGLALILVTHDPSEVRLLCESLAVLENGQIVERGLLDEVTREPRSALTRAFKEQLHDRTHAQRREPCD